MRLVAIILLLTIVGLSGGCFYVPRAPRHTLGPNVPDVVGSARSTKAIRPGASSREQIEETFGRPHEDDGARLRYYWAEDVGMLYTLWNPFNESHEHPQVRTRVIEFRFDDAGTLRGYRVRGAARLRRLREDLGRVPTVTAVSRITRHYEGLLVKRSFLTLR
jgi:hypothetical protein